jgi:hypothetical protein
VIEYLLVRVEQDLSLAQTAEEENTCKNCGDARHCILAHASKSSCRKSRYRLV